MKKLPTEWLADVLTGGAADPGNISVRRKYGTVSSIFGIVCNSVLFAVKLAVGFLTSSVAVISDAFNNLSDFASCVISLIGVRLASKPADKEHPFGHGRMEYLTALWLSVGIIVMGLRLLEESVLKVIHPDSVETGAVTFVILIAAVLVKFIMYRFNTVLGNRINSVVLKAAAKDSLGDAAATSAITLSLLLGTFIDLPLDGIAGAVVSLLILRTGTEIIRDTTDELIGKPADEDMKSRIRRLAAGYDRILGIHDIVLHSYGPTKLMGSCHAEISDKEDFRDAHELADALEREIYDTLGINITIHTDPVAVDDEKTAHYRARLAEILEKLGGDISFHDLHAVSENGKDRISFDLSVPFDVKTADDELKEAINKALSDEPCPVRTLIIIDRE